MSRFMMLDIGAGTMDVLCYDDESDLHYKAVVMSPVRHMAEQIARIPGNLIVTGAEMGGGPVSTVLEQRAKDAQVAMSASAAATIHHNPERIRSAGIRIVSDAEAGDLLNSPGYSPVQLGDLQTHRIEKIVRGLATPFEFDVVGICAQDHGVPPAGMSHLDYRHHLFREQLDKAPYPHTVLYGSENVPASLNRLSSIAKDAAGLPAGEVYVMDSGMAAINGASADILAKGKNRILVLDVATSHTVGAAVCDGEIAGFFEYHTHDITLERIEVLMRSLADGNLSHEQMLKEGGHGAYIRKTVGFQSVEIILATGPKRRLLRDTELPVTYGAPLGDNMMTGTFGMLEAIRKRKGLPPLEQR